MNPRNQDRADAPPDASPNRITSPEVKARLDSLTVLRFIAAAWVLTLHLNSRAPLPVPPLWHRLFGNGAYAMTVFFVLSGTVLAYGYHWLRPRAEDVIAFYQSRFARIYASYAALHLVVLVFLFPTNPADMVPAIYTNVLSALGLQAWFPHSASGAGAANGSTWSISAEFFFYALFPALLPALAYLKGRMGTLRLGAYLAALSGLIGFADVFYPNGFTFYLMPAARLPEFMLGVVLGLALVEHPTGQKGNTLMLVAAALAAVGVALNPVRDYGWWIRANFVAVPVFAWLIFELARWDQRRTAASWATARPLVYLGECSYALFLFQILPLIFIDSAVGRAWLNRNWPGGNETLWAAVALLSLAGAVAMHELIEKPARRALLRHWRPAQSTGTVN